MTQLAVSFLYLPGGNDKSHDNPIQLSRCPFGQSLESTSSQYDAKDSGTHSGKVNTSVLFQAPPSSGF